MVAFSLFKVNGFSFKSFLSRLLFSLTFIFSAVAHADRCEPYLNTNAAAPVPQLESLVKHFDGKTDQTSQEKLTQRLGLSGLVLTMLASPLFGNIIDSEHMIYVHSGIVTFFGMVVVPRITQKLRGSENVRNLYIQKNFILNFKRAINPEFNKLITNYFEEKGSLSDRLANVPNNSFKSLEAHIFEIHEYHEVLTMLKGDIERSLVMARVLIEMSKNYLGEVEEGKDPNPMNIVINDKATEESLLFTVTSQNIMTAHLTATLKDVEDGLFYLNRINDLIYAHRGKTPDAQILSNNELHYNDFKESVDRISYGMEIVYGNNPNY